MSKILNLSKYNKFTDDLISNLKILEKEFGNKFIIKSEILNAKITVTLNKFKLANGNIFYQLNHFDNKRYTPLNPMRINFLNPQTNQIDGTSFIANIHKTNEYSGTTIVKLCLEINKIFGIKKTYLTDGAKTKCGDKETYLSFIKLLENNKTFYMALGFQIELWNNDSSMLNLEIANTNQKLLFKLNKTIENIKKIKTKTIINEYCDTIDLLTDAIKTNFSKDFEIIIYKFNTFCDDEYYKEDSIKHVSDYFNECIKVLSILNKYKDKQFLFEILIYLFKNSCEDYIKIYDYLIATNRIKIIYGKKVIEKKYIRDFKLLIQLYQSHVYSYTF